MVWMGLIVNKVPEYSADGAAEESERQIRIYLSS